MPDTENAVLRLDIKKEFIKRDLLRTIRMGYPKLRAYFESQSASELGTQLTDEDDQIPLDTLYSLGRYLELYDDYENDILGLLNDVGPFLFNFSLSDKNIELQNECWNVLLALVKKSELPMSFIQELADQLGKNEQQTLEAIIAELSYKVFTHREMYVDEEQIDGLMRYATWLLETVFSKMAFDTEIHQEAITNFVIVLVGTNKLCKDFIPNARETALFEHMRKAVAFAEQNGKHSDIIVRSLKQPSSPRYPLFTLAEFLELINFSDLYSEDSALVDKALLNVETVIEQIASEQGITSESVLPLLTELRYLVGGRLRSVAEDLFSQYLDPLGFTSFEARELLETWIDSHFWSEHTEKSWKRSEKLYDKISGELRRISDLHSVVAGAPTMLYRDYGITHFTRYPLEMLLIQAKRESARIKGEPLSQDKPLAIVVTAVDDHNFAFNSLRQQLSQLNKVTEEQYEYILLEFDYKRKLHEKLQEIRNTRGRFSLMLLSGHGSEVSIQLGKTFRVGAFITIKDAFLGIVRDPNRYFEPNGLIILNSCSTAKQREVDVNSTDDPEVPTDIPHIAAALAHSFQVTVIGPNEPSSIKTFAVAEEMSGGLSTISVTYQSEKEPPYSGIVVTPKTQK